MKEETMQRIQKMTRGRARGAGAVVLALLLVSACENSPTHPAPGEQLAVDRVMVTPASAQLLPGEIAQLTAVARAADNTVLSGRTVTWQSFNTATATVSTTGLVTAVGSGHAVIRATVDGISADVPVAVAGLNPVPVLTAVNPQAIETTTPVAVLTVLGERFAPGAVILWDGVARPAMYVGPTELRLVLGASDIQSVGMRQLAVRNPAPGGGESDVLPVTVVVGVSSVVVTPVQLTLSVGRSAPLHARALDANGSELPDRTFTYASSNAGAVSVSPEGLVTAHGVGPAIITVSSGGRSAQVQVTAVPAVQTVVVTPSPAAVLVGQTVRLTARALGMGGVELPGRPVVWSSLDPEIATVDDAGRVTGLAKGTARIRAESEGASGLAEVEVRQWGPGPVSTLTLRGFAETMIWPSVGATTWTDGQGIVHPATKTLTGGTLTLRFDTGRWHRTYAIQIYVATQSVATETWVEEGTFGYIFGGGYWFRSDATGETVQGLDTLPGEVQIRQGVGTSPALTQRWVVQ
jgi:uncharacterized protein YjdB